MSGYTLRAVPAGVIGWDAHEEGPDGSVRTLCECEHDTMAEAIACARATLDAGEDLGGVVMEVVAALESVGWRP